MLFRASTAFSAFRTGLAAAGLATVIMSAAGAVHAEETVRFGSVGGLSNSSIAVAVADNEGAYKAAGITFDLVEFKGGGPAVQALVGGATDICICAPEHVIRLRNRGIDAVVLAPLSNRIAYAIYGPAGSTETGLESLKGKKVGITSPGSKTDTLIRLALTRAGLRPDLDVEIVALGGTAGQLSALQTGNIAAGFIGALEALDAESNGHPIVYDWRQQALPDLALITTEQWIEQNPETARNLARETLAAAKRIVEDRQLSTTTLRRLYPQFTDKIIELAADQLHQNIVVTPVFDEGEFKDLVAELVELEPAIKPIPVEQFNRDFTQ